MFDLQTSLNCRGRLLDLSRPKIMGILNVTPDSFHDGGQFRSIDEILSHVDSMLREGAAIIDIGAASSRPGAEIISPEEEWARLEEPFKKIRQKFTEVFISVDTYNAKTASRVLSEGADIINDISAGEIDPSLLDVVAENDVPYVLMHMQGKPNTMQKAPEYEDVVLDVLDFFINRVEELRKKGIKDIVLDPGFGFGKNVAHNFKLLRKLHVFGILDLPVMAGVSRKSMICKTLEVNPKDALNGTTALHMVALEEKAKILRVHDVQEASETIKLWEALNANSNQPNTEKQNEG